MTKTLLIENGAVIDGTGAAPVRASVLVSGSTILAIGAEADARAAQAQRAERYDAQGCTIMPGLIDAHCHLSFDDAGSNIELFTHRRNALTGLVAAYNARKLLRAGVTSVLDPDSLFESMLDLRDAIDAGVVEGPRMSCGSYALMTAVGGTAGRLIGDSGVTGYAKVVTTREEIVTEVRRQIKYGADWIKVHVTGVIPRQAHKGEMSVWTYDELKLLCDTAHELDTPVMAHCRGAKSVRDSALAGVDLLFHATGMDEAALEAVVDRKIPICPAFTFQANMVDFAHRLGTDASLQALFEREITDSAESLITAHKAGVPMLCGSESGFSMVPYGHWHYREMEVFTRYLGMTPLEAIACGTSAGAVAMRMPGSVGTLAAGWQADLICVEGDPSRDVTILGETDRIRMVMIAGKPMDISPLPPRRPIPGWNIAAMGAQLTREFAFSNTLAAPSGAIQELH